MREIKSRGKYKYSEENIGWIYGLPVKDSDGDVYIFPDGGTHFTQGDWWFDNKRYGLPCVDPETIGQFTGLTDKNGKRIFEGDIVEYVSWNEYFSKDGKPMEPFRRKMFVDYRKGGFKMVEPMPEPMKDNEWDIICNGDIVVIGNIHDDPQLIDMKRLG